MGRDAREQGREGAKHWRVLHYPKYSKTPWLLLQASYTPASVAVAQAPWGCHPSASSKLELGAEASLIHPYLGYYLRPCFCALNFHVP